MGFLDGLIGKVRVALSGTLLPSQPTVNFIGATVADDPINNRTNVTIPASSAAPSVASLAALRGLSTLDGTVTNGQQRAVQGTRLIYVYSTTTGANFVDDSHLTIKPNDVSTGNNGRWYLVASTGVYNARDYGMHPNASMAANTAALVAACTAANASGGGIVYIEAGDYNVVVPAAHGSSAFHLTGISHVTIQGAGRDKARLVDGGVKASAGELYPTETGDPGGTAAFLTFDDAANVHFRGLGFVGKGVFQQSDVGQAAVNKKAIYFKHVTNGTTDCSVTDCHFSNIEGEVVFADGKVTRLHVVRPHFTRCLTNHVNVGGGDRATYPVLNCYCIDGTFESVGGSAFQGSGDNWLWARNTICMLPADAAITTSTTMLLVNTRNWRSLDNVFDGQLHQGGSPIYEIGYQGDTNGNDGLIIRDTFSRCEILGKAASTVAAVIAIDSSYGPQTGYDIDCKFLACDERAHLAYPNIIAVRVTGTFPHSGSIGPNRINNTGATYGIQTAVHIDATVGVGNKIIVKAHDVDALTTTPYDFVVQPYRVGTTFGQPDMVLTEYAGTPEGFVTAGKGSICGDRTNGALYVKNTGTGNTGWALLGTSGSEVPTSRTLTGSGAVKIAGDNAAHDLSADRTISIADAAAGTKGVIELDTDLGGSASAPTVVALTGASNNVAVKAASLTLDAARALLQIIGATAGQSFQLYFANAIQFTALAGGLGIILDSDITKFRDSAGTQRGQWDGSGLAIGSSGSAISKHLSASQAPTFGTITVGTSAENEFTFAGAAIGDNVYASPDADPGANLAWCAYVKTAGKVTIRLLAGATVVTNNVNWRVDVWKH